MEWSIINKYIICMTRSPRHLSDRSDRHIVQLDHTCKVCAVNQVITSTNLQWNCNYQLTLIRLQDRTRFEQRCKKWKNPRARRWVESYQHQQHHIIVEAKKKSCAMTSRDAFPETALSTLPGIASKAHRHRRVLFRYSTSWRAARTAPGCAICSLFESWCDFDNAGPTWSIPPGRLY